MKTIIEIATNRVIGATYSNECLETEILIDELLQVVMIKPFFDFSTRTFFEGATQQEIDEANRAKVPSEVQLWRVRTVLKLNNLETTIENAFDSLQEPTKTGALYVWNYGTTIERFSDTVLFLQSVLQMTNEQVDQIFIQAEAITI
jgi:hypothetical protein